MNARFLLQSHLVLASPVSSGCDRLRVLSPRDLDNLEGWPGILRMSPSLGLSDVRLLMSLGMWVFGDRTEVECPSHCLLAGVGDVTTMSLLSACQPSPLTSTGFPFLYSSV